MSEPRLHVAAAIGLWLLAACAAGTGQGGPLPNPPPFAEALTGEGTRKPVLDLSKAEAVPSPVANSGNGGGSGRGPRATAPTPRFFFAGSGRLRLQHAHFNTTLDVRYRKPDGSYDPEALAQIASFFRSREDGRQGRMSLRLIELLSYVQSRFHPREMILASGYRSPEFNENLRAAGGAQAQTSLHTQGLAADVALPGLNLERTWQQLRELGAGGVGYYRSGNFLHFDSGPPRFWEETTSRVKENLSGDNARIFLRTDFDRYTSLDGALLDLYSITTFPVLIAPDAELSGNGGTTRLSIEPADGTAVGGRDGCFVIAAPAEAYRFRVRADGPLRAGGATLSLRTCAPRVGRTPAEVVSNPIEVQAGR